MAAKKTKKLSTPTQTVAELAKETLSVPAPGPTQFESVVSELIEYTRLGMNAMLIGKHGVGKTSAIQEACKREGWNMWYASAPLLDPDIDLGGIPVPDKETGKLKFYTQPQLFEAEVIFLDELNRASPRTLNMIFELVQFKSIHGKKLPKLKAVHTGINPPGQGQYDVQTLDDALLDRFHAFIEMTAEFPEAVILPILGATKTGIMRQWYENHLSNVFVSPRRMVYAAGLYVAGMPMERAFTEPKVPVGRLKQMLSEADLGGVEAKVNKVPNAWDEEKFETARNHPLLQEDTKELARIMQEIGITPAEVWAEVIAERERVAAGE